MAIADQPRSKKEVLLPNQDALGAVFDRLHAAGIPVTEEAHGWAVFDPSHNRVCLQAAYGINDET